MAIDFPNSPSPGQQFTVGPITWSYVDGRWVLNQGGALLTVTPWEPLTLVAPWIEYAATYEPEWRMFGDEVQVRGLVQTNGSAVASFANIATGLPSAPGGGRLFVAGSSSSVVGMLDVTGTNLRIRQAGTYGLLSLDNIRYSVTPSGVLPAFSQVPSSEALWDRLQTGLTTAVTTTAGLMTIPFPTAYSSAPDVVAMPYSTSTTAIFCKVHQVTATDFTVRVFSGSPSSPSNTGTINIYWWAFGELTP